MSPYSLSTEIHDWWLRVHRDQTVQLMKSWIPIVSKRYSGDRGMHAYIRLLLRLNSAHSYRDCPMQSLLRDTRQIPAECHLDEPVHRLSLELHWKCNQSPANTAIETQLIRCLLTTKTCTQSIVHQSHRSTGWVGSEWVTNLVKSAMNWVWWGHETV